jgi:membrane dipeptidase
MERHQPNPSRRGFLTTLVGAGGAMLLGSGQLQSVEVDPRVAQIVSRTIAVDMHNHMQIPYAKVPAHAKPDPALDLAGEMKRSGFSAVIETYPPDDLWSTQPDEHYKYHLQALAFVDRLLASNHMRRALNMKDLQTAHDQGLPVIIQSAEGAQFVEGHLERVGESYKRGLRNLQLVHEQDDVVSPLGDVYTATPHFGGLTPFGGEVIRECNRLGIVVDLTHGTYEMVKAALKVARQPSLYSHTALQLESGNKNISADILRRLFGKEEARAVADAGGVIGIWWRGAESTKEYVAGIKYMVDAVGVDHVGIGTDTDLTLVNGSLPYTNGIWEDQDVGFFYAVAGEMLKQGFTPDEIGRIGGGNFCRVFAKVTEGRS